MSKTVKKEKSDNKSTKKALLRNREEKNEKKFKFYHWAVEVNECKRKAGLNSERF